jgi:predicted lipoprotein with Yx(FWY)xxD motif
MRKPFLLAVPAVALIAAGCGSSATKTGTSNAPGAAKSSYGTASSSSSSSGGSSGKISTASIKGLGTVLVNSQGRTLYVFKPDNAKKVTCTGSCAAVWPPAKVTGKPTASGSVKASMLSSDPNPSGGQVATYNGWPLYTYVTDTGAGSARGQALNLNGGLWYVMSPSGQPITKKPPSSGYGSSGY